MKTFFTEVKFKLGESGQTLVGVLVAAGISGLVVLALSSSMSTMILGSQTAVAANSATDITSIVKGIIGSEAGCQLNLVLPNYSYDTSSAASPTNITQGISFVTSAGASAGSYLQAGSASQGFTVTSIQLQPRGFMGSQTYLADLQINLTKNLQTLSPSNTVVKTIPVQIMSTGGKITGCYQVTNGTEQLCADAGGTYNPTTAVCTGGTKTKQGGCGAGQAVTGYLGGNPICGPATCSPAPSFHQPYFSGWCQDLCNGTAKWTSFNVYFYDIPLCGTRRADGVVDAAPNGGIIPMGVGSDPISYIQGSNLVCFVSTTPLNVGSCVPGVGQCGTTALRNGTPTGAPLCTPGQQLTGNQISSSVTYADCNNPPGGHTYSYSTVTFTQTCGSNKIWQTRVLGPAGPPFLSTCQ